MGETEAIREREGNAGEVRDNESRNGPEAGSHFVYVIEGAAGFVKIGRSGNLAKRLAQLQNGSPIRLNVARTWDVGNEMEADRFERRLHRAFGEVRGSGEWFRLEARWVVAVGDAMLRFDSRTANDLIATFMNLVQAEDLIGEFEHDEDHEEADLWRCVCEGYRTRARGLGLPPSACEIALQTMAAPTQQEPEHG